MGTIKYRKPPITERAVSFGFTLPEEDFQRKISSWSDIVRDVFPHSKIANQWQISIADKDGVPFIPKENQKFTTKYQFREGNNKRWDHGIQVWSDRVTFNLIGGLQSPRTYEDLKLFHDEWLPRWADYFCVTELHGATLEYVNLLTESTIPSFCKDERISIGQILSAFVTPGPIKALVPPFSFDMNFEDQRHEVPIRFHAGLSTIPNPKISLKLLFRASTEVLGRKISIDHVQQEIDTCHAVILEEFEAFFTTEAKNSFEPYDADTTKHE